MHVSNVCCPVLTILGTKSPAINGTIHCYFRRVGEGVGIFENPLFCDKTKYWRVAYTERQCQDHRKQNSCGIGNEYTEKTTGTPQPGVQAQCQNRYTRVAEVIRPWHTRYLLPVFCPELTFREDGCEIAHMSPGYAVVRGYGSGISMGGTKPAIELKCPIKSVPPMYIITSQVIIQRRYGVRWNLNHVIISWTYATHQAAQL